LQKASDKFYPDFVIKMQSGLFVALEYKDSHLADGRDGNEKKKIGELLARRSNGACCFVWVEKGQFNLIKEAVS
jgi:type III restriction enzyme